MAVTLQQARFMCRHHSINGDVRAYLVPSGLGFGLGLGSGPGLGSGLGSGVKHRPGGPVVGRGRLAGFTPGAPGGALG